MIRKNIDLFLCPRCKSSFSEEMIESDKISCKCGITYPFINGVPNFLDSGLENFSKKNLKRINETFSNQWNMFKYEGNYKTWDWNVGERLQLFFREIASRPKDLAHKKLLDAGCGNGVLTSLISRFQCESYGLDISDSVFRASFECKPLWSPNNPAIFSKGSLTNPPFKEKTFDYIYSSGVLHHNKNTRESLKLLIPLLKEDGKIYVWLYKKRIIQQLYAEPLRKVVVHLPPELMSGFTRLLSFPFQFMRKLNNIVKGRQYANYNLDELQLSLHDTFSPTYVNQHDEKELISWFKEFGFKNYKVTVRDRHGFGIIASKIEL